MNYTKKYEQCSKEAARKKFGRMANGVGRQSNVSSFECAFSTWWWGKDIGEDENPNLWDGEYAIFVSTNYHPETSLDKMYKTNCKEIS